MFEIIGTIFEVIFYRPLFNGLIFIYYYLPWEDLGIAIIIFTILIKAILYPFGAKAIKSQRSLAKLSPQIKEIKEKHKNNKEKQTKEIMDFYKKEKVNPFSGCLPLLVQFPVLIALFRIFRGEFGMEQMELLYSFTPSPEKVFTGFLGIFDLAEPSLFFALLAGISIFYQMKLSSPKIKKKLKGELKDDVQIVMQKQMQYFMPFFTVFILLQLPSALGLYWTTSTFFAIGQQYLIKKREPFEKKENNKN